MSVRWSALCSLLLVACATASVSEEDATRARIHYDIAVSSLGRGELREALRELLTSVQKNPELAVAHNALGLVYHAMGRSEESYEHYKKALAASPNFSEAHNNFGILLIDLGRYDEAIAAFKIALGDILYATPSLAEGNLGWAYYKRGDLATARKHLRNAVATSPKFCRGYEWLARMGLDTNDIEQVISSAQRFEKYCAADAELARTLPADYVSQMQYYLAMGYLQRGDSHAARAVLATCAQGSSEGAFAGKCQMSLEALD